MTKNKIKSQREIARIARSFKKKRRRIVFTNGCFDILHKGHISYLQKARGYGDVLIIGLNADVSVRKIKDAGRPINKQQDRAYVLAALECVDFIVFFSAATPEDLIRKIRPDVLIKGGDWRPDQVAGGEFLRRNGGEVIILPYIRNYSTSKIIRKIKRKS